VKIDAILQQRKPCFSFEFFPPQSDDGVARLLSTVEVLRPLEPAFVSVTYGAGGSTRARTIEVTKAIKRDLGIEAMAHLTCVGADVSGLRGVLDEDQPRARALLREAGIAPAVRFSEDLARSREPRPESRRASMSMYIRLGLLGIIALLIVLHFLDVF